MSSASSFFASKAFAVVGASADRSKFGNKVLRWYKDNGFTVTPINPRDHSIEEIECAKTLEDLAASRQPADLRDLSISVVTPPSVSEKILRDAAKQGARKVWFQPGSEPDNWKMIAEELGVEAIGNGPCVLKVDLDAIPRSKL
ncbi:hypothetical protein J3B02_001737 [Coemansia erecta]|uniref:CoA-binding domain-containing protein n=1 Tax=Coemansia asiatica TaxID=1052880 RepID=A0A9W7XN66_9FUNG|nr:hypothetical protein LPJ64_002665 [Coemansia asiatica]KAJ2856207.1 hypothetical protein J3B02_001737 [Coemansia erecta]KAJ2878736.1 hypothetical protein FB639_003292 [Coemansia asiatica]